MNSAQNMCLFSIMVLVGVLAFALIAFFPYLSQYPWLLIVWTALALSLIPVFIFVVKLLFRIPSKVELKGDVLRMYTLRGVKEVKIRSITPIRVSDYLTGRWCMIGIDAGLTKAGPFMTVDGRKVYAFCDRDEGVLVETDDGQAYVIAVDGVENILKQIRGEV